jgi:type VI secretion system secreted protein Hcp
MPGTPDARHARSEKEVSMTTNTHVPSRRTILAGALGVGALGSVAASAVPANAALGDPAVPDDPEVAYFLSIPGIPGGSTTKGFEGQIELLTWAWGADSSGSLSSGGGGGAGKTTSRQLIALAELGVQSPQLLLETNTGQHLQTAVLTCIRKSRKPFTFLTVKLEEVLITSYAVTPDPTNGVPLDLVHLELGKVTYSVIPQNPDGSVGTPITTAFDYRTNKAG